MVTLSEKRMEEVKDLKKTVSNLKKSTAVQDERIDRFSELENRIDELKEKVVTNTKWRWGLFGAYLLLMFALTVLQAFGGAIF